MTAFIDRLRSPPPLMWLDATAYAARLLARGQVPWLEPGAYVAWQRQTQLLLDSDVIGVPLASLSEAWLQAHPDLRAGMAAKRKPTHPLRTLLSDVQLRLHAAGLIKDLRTMFAHRILALVIPAPGAWVAAAHAQAHGTGTNELPTVDADAAESAGVYVADFLRVFADGALDVLLLQESTTECGSALDDAAHLPIANLAAHCRWDCGLHSTTAATRVRGGMAFVIAPPPIALPNTCVPIPANFWLGDSWAGEEAAPLTGSFVFAEIPAGADPQRVLERLRLLREASDLPEKA
jgi:hypothetical protein